MLEWARSEGFSAVRLWVPAHGDRARSLYAGAGFVPTGASREVHGELPFVANEMRLDLGAQTRPPDRGKPR